MEIAICIMVLAIGFFLGTVYTDFQLLRGERKQLKETAQPEIAQPKSANSVNWLPEAETTFWREDDKATLIQ